MGILTPGTYQELDLSVADVDAYTNGQLAKDDPATQSMLDAALAVARRDVRWHVNPVAFGEVISLNGHGGVKLWLPTKNVVALHSITDVIAGSIALPAGILFDADLPNKIYLNTGQVWCCGYSGISGITVTWDHGFTNSQAQDWRNAILALVTNIAQISVLGRSDAELEGKRIDDVDYAWAAHQALGSVEPTLAKYRMLSAWV